MKITKREGVFVVEHNGESIQIMLEQFTKIADAKHPLTALRQYLSERRDTAGTKERRVIETIMGDGLDRFPEALDTFKLRVSD